MFDTLMYAKRLEAAGLTRDQAEAQINIIAEMVVDGVATKQDMTVLKQEVTLLKQDMSVVKQDIVLLKQDLVAFRLEVAKEFAETKLAFEKVYLAIAQESSKNLKIMGAMFLASTTITVGVLGLLLK